MPRRALRLLLVASVLYGTGAHWAALQAYAWSTMKLAGQSDPCHVCEIVEKGTSAEAPVHRGSIPSVELAVPVASFEAAVLPPAAVSAAPFPPYDSVWSPPATPPPDRPLPA
jgi:hypothetical protein